MRYVAWTALVLAGVLSHLVDAGRLGRPVVPALERVPERLGTLELVEEVAFDTAVLGEMPPERHLFRRYADADGRGGVLYVAYFLRGKRWSGRPHPVDVCFLSQGWTSLEARVVETASGASVWIQDFERPERRIRVVHWLQRPGSPPRMGIAGSVLARIARLGNLRQDVASAYLEFPLETAPPDPVLVEAADELIGTLEELWR